MERKRSLKSPDDAELLEHLDLLMSYETLEQESDWDLAEDLDEMADESADQDAP